MRFRPITLVATLALIAGCASMSTGNSDRQRRSSDTITRAELEELGNYSAFDVVRRIRMQWLQPRGGRSIRGGDTLPSLFIDRRRQGVIAELRDIPADDVESMRFISASDATTQYGTGFPYGIIEVSMRRR